MSKIISIEGNIGSGKSTIISIIHKLLEKRDDIEFLKEPVDKWINTCDEDGNNILDVFYKNQKRWSYSFQMNAYITKLQQLEMACQKESNKLVVCERSVETDRHCFAKQLAEDGLINKMEWQLYDNWYYWLKEKTNCKLDGIIYLKCSPEVSYERINIRKRKEENNIPMDYLTKIHNKHNEWLSNPDVPLLVLDVNNDFENNAANKKIVVNKIYGFLQKIMSV